LGSSSLIGGAVARLWLQRGRGCRVFGLVVTAAAAWERVDGPIWISRLARKCRGGALKTRTRLWTVWLVEIGQTRLSPARSPDDEKFEPPARQRARQATAAAGGAARRRVPDSAGPELKMPRPAATCAVCLKALAEGIRRPCRTRPCCNWLGWTCLAHPEERDHVRLSSDGLGA
jgi:hypothetical protein